jgi:hypothetical protein
MEELWKPRFSTESRGFLFWSKEVISWPRIN